MVTGFCCSTKIKLNLTLGESFLPLRVVDYILIKGGVISSEIFFMTSKVILWNVFVRTVSCYLI